MEAGRLVPPERLPCPACRRVTDAPTSAEPIEVVHCSGCGKLLRRRPRLGVEQRAEALTLRWVAALLEQDHRIALAERRRKPRGDDTEIAASVLLRTAEQLREWARTVHKREPIREPGDGMVAESRRRA